jgi:hypothetical protein
LVYSILSSCLAPFSVVFCCCHLFFGFGSSGDSSQSLALSTSAPAPAPSVSFLCWSLHWWAPDTPHWSSYCQN